MIFIGMLKSQMTKIFSYNFLIVLLSIFFLSNVHSVSQESDELSYELVVNGLDEGELDFIKDTFNESSILLTGTSKPVISAASLRNNLAADADILEQVLRSEGYYNSEIHQTFSRENNGFILALDVTPGPQYVYGEIEIVYKDFIPDGSIQENINSAMGLTVGDPAKAGPVLNAQSIILNTLPKHGFPFVGDIESDFTVDHLTKKMDVIFKINTGGRRKMGSVNSEGLTSVDKAYPGKFLIWPEDSYYKQQYIADLRSRLIKSNLFSGVSIDVKPGDNDLADITVNLIEAKQRTVGTSAGYSTAEGFGAGITWEHRNIMGAGEKLKVSARASQIEQSLAGRLEIPHYKRLDQTISFEGVARRQDTDAFFAHVVETRAGIDRVVNSDIALLATVEMEYSDVTDALGNRDFFLVSLPFGVRWDNSDNLLDPSRGVRASIITAPSYAISDRNFEFLKTEFRASAYFPLNARESFIFAVRSRIGSIIGVENEALPAIRRFFSGGGGSIRGYGFQRVGPFATDGNPLGGRSVNELATELRWKFENNLGLVLFAEGGNVYEETSPQFNDFRYAAGIGARYATGFGPVRFDVAFPLNKRAGDSSFQIYISLGQAF